MIGVYCRAANGFVGNVPRLDDSRGSNRHPDAAVLLKPPVQHVVVIPNNRGRTKHQRPRRTPKHQTPVLVPPGNVSGESLKQASLAWPQRRIASLVARKPVKIHRVGRAVQSWL